MVLLFTEPIDELVVIGWVLSPIWQVVIHFFFLNDSLIKLLVSWVMAYVIGYVLRQLKYVRQPTLILAFSDWVIKLVFYVLYVHRVISLIFFSAIRPDCVMVFVICFSCQFKKIFYFPVIRFSSWWFAMFFMAWFSVMKAFLITINGVILLTVVHYWLTI